LILLARRAALMQAALHRRCRSHRKRNRQRLATHARGISEFWAKRL